MNKIKLLLADDHQMLLDSMREMLEKEADLEVVAQALNGKEVLEQLQKYPVDVCLLDIQMPVMDGVEACARIRAEFPEVKVLILTMLNEDQYVTHMIESGAQGYILKDAGKTELLDAIHDLVARKDYYSRDVMRTVIDSHRKVSRMLKEKVIKLTRREKDVLVLIAKSYTALEIAEHLHISTNTVDTHRKNLMSKLKAKNTVDLVKYAIREGYITVNE